MGYGWMQVYLCVCVYVHVPVWNRLKNLAIGRV